eukprot:8748151-Ditylum_brightwellii.AAC.1
MKSAPCQAFKSSANHDDENTVETAAFLGLDRDLKYFKVLLRRSRTSGRAKVASFVMIDKRGSPHLDELA